MVEVVAVPILDRPDHPSFKSFSSPTGVPFLPCPHRLSCCPEVERRSINAEDVDSENRDAELFDTSLVE